MSIRFFLSQENKSTSPVAQTQVCVCSESMSQALCASTITSVHLCVRHMCKSVPVSTCAPHYVFSSAVNAVVIGEKLPVIEFHAARGSGVRIGISAAAFPFPLGGLHSGAAACADFKQANQNKQAKDAKDNPNYTPETAACVACLCVFVHTCREIPAFFASAEPACGSVICFCLIFFFYPSYIIYKYVCVQFP